MLNSHKLTFRIKASFLYLIDDMNSDVFTENNKLLTFLTIKKKSKIY
jgi:hypothetical protein